MSAPLEPIAVVGVGCRFAGEAKSPSALWDLLRKPTDASRDLTDRFDTASFYHPKGQHHGTTNVRQGYLMREDLGHFDANFFNISANEAEAMDPQQKLLLEVVYEAMEKGGHTIEGLKGSNTSVFVGTMGVDYNDTLLRDLSNIPNYFATGVNRAIISNRVSYFYDWHGPSMTIDTACSSSLIAVHQGVKALRHGESRTALVCGTQIIIGPEAFVAESKMNMLSPTGRSRMWDADADGYARGEGVAAVVLKKLSDAIADKDDIVCLVRETGTNQDGHSNGITVPSTEAQAALIRQTYARAGLDPSSELDRPQFFEAHGTGTKAGDPKEAAAIFQCFGEKTADANPLYVGSIKTVIGHTEGAAGLAGLIKASLMVQNGIIVPNLLFNRLNPDIEPYYKNLRVPVSLMPWPKIPEGVPRRASVNSFGFGGSNAHAIVEQYIPSVSEASTDSASNKDLVPFTPYVFSATSEASLSAYLQACSKYLGTQPGINLADLAWTLQSRRTQFSTRASFAAPSIEALKSELDKKIAEIQSKSSSGGGALSKASTSEPKILGVFTGQGAQWPGMGGRLILGSDHVRGIVSRLEEDLATLPESERPKWSLEKELLAGADTSRIAAAELSQPLCTALQIILVDLLALAGVKFGAVVGHSSGEIGAAYAAGFLSARDAIRVAYFRGLHAHHAGNKATGQPGAMLAVGTSREDAQELVSLTAFKGKITVAAENSAASVTLSGDRDAILRAKSVFEEEKKFARMLKVDKAYHSHHMAPCGIPYMESMRACGIKPLQNTDEAPALWYSSVTADGSAMQSIDALGDTYWRDNMANEVLFAKAIQNALQANPQLSFALEVGPHPALQGPAVQNIAEVQAQGLPYCGTLQRGGNDIEAFAQALGKLWSQFSNLKVDFAAFERALSGQALKPSLVTTLPSYQWNHARRYWYETKQARKVLKSAHPFHELLGVQTPGSNLREVQWRNTLKPSEIPWLEGHKLQGQIVFPAAGYIAMALEAARSLVAGRQVELFEIRDFTIPRAIAFDEDSNAGVETLVTLTAITPAAESSTLTTAEYCCYSRSSNGPDNDMELMAKCTLAVVHGSPAVAALPSEPVRVSSMAPVDTDRFYTTLLNLGYGYSGPFRTMSHLKRKQSQSAVFVDSYNYPDTDVSPYLVHPTWLDVGFQAAILAYSAPGDERLWSLHVPTSIGVIRVNPLLCETLPTTGCPLPVCTTLRDSEDFYGSIDFFRGNGQNAMVQVDGLVCKAFAPASVGDDRRMFTHTIWDVAAPRSNGLTSGASLSSDESDLASTCERVAYYFARQWNAEVASDDWTRHQPHYGHIRDYIKSNLGLASSGRHATWKQTWAQDQWSDIEAAMARHPKSIDLKLLCVVGKNMPAAVRGTADLVNLMQADDMLTEYNVRGLGHAFYDSLLANMVKQTSHRYPHLRILEMGDGAGGAHKTILEAVGDSWSSYTYTNIVSKVEPAKTQTHGGRLSFKSLDITADITTQGYEQHAYDMVVSSRTFRSTSAVRQALSRVRQLLRPGGLLLLSEMTHEAPTRITNIMCGLDSWWDCKNEASEKSQAISPAEWHRVLRQSGFSGVDSITPKIDASRPFSVICTQAVDDQIAFLRRPLSHAATSSPVYIDNLVILGTKSLENARIAEELSDYVRPFCGEITMLPSLPTEAEATSLSPLGTFVNLVDLEDQIFRDLSEERMDGLKRMYDLSKHILWLTMGAISEDPYHSASVAFSRAMSYEAKHISMNHLDIPSLGDDSPRFIAEYLLQQLALDEWTPSGDGLLQQGIMWSKEPEARLENGVLKLPRLVDLPDQNARLNAIRRPIQKSISESKALLSCELSESLIPSLTESPLGQHGVKSGGAAAVKVQLSTAMALHVVPEVYLFCSIGQDSATGNSVIGLSTTNSSEVIPTACIVARSTACAEGLLVAVTNELVATCLLENVPRSSSMLLHFSQKDVLLVDVLTRQAEAKGIRIAGTYPAGSIDGKRNPEWTSLRPRLARHALRRSLRIADPTHFLDLTGDGTSSTELATELAQCLPKDCKRFSSADLARHQASRPCDLSIPAGRLQAALFSAENLQQEQIQDVVSPLDQVAKLSTPMCQSDYIRWSSELPFDVMVRPLGADVRFSKDKTYFLVGLSGQLGKSLCEWMIMHGAGCVCLSSRSPKVDEEWIRSFESTGAKVKTYALDITNRQRLGEVVRDIEATCPPIAGVAQGAMVLHDQLFSEMSTATMRQCLDPKIVGANNLDDVFFDTKLDFFLMLSSSVCIVGNSGQTNYSAANGYLDGLARNRRSRGLAASSIDIGRVAGLGYVESAGEIVANQLRKFGLMPVSESDFRHLFAETILAGSVDSGSKAVPKDVVVTSGLRKIRDDEKILGPWFDNPRFSHCIIESGGMSSGGESGSKKTNVSVREGLASATNAQQAIEIIEGSFASKLASTLQLDDSEVDRAMPLIDIGVDSLLAVEIRSWFLKELKVDIPVLRIIGGATPSDLCRRAFDILSQDSLSGLSEGNLRRRSVVKAEATAKQEKQQPKVEKKAKPTVKPTAASQAATTATAKVIKREPMSFGQSRFWFLKLLIKDQTTFNVAFNFRLSGPLRIAKLEQAVRTVAARHESLRTAFVAHATDAEHATQQVMSASTLRLEHKDIQSTDEVATEYQLLRNHEWNFETGDLFRLVLLSLSPTSHFLLVAYHHILMDGYSFQVFMADLEKAYTGQALGAAPRQFPDFSAAQRSAYDSGAMTQELAYWRSIFPADSPPPVLPLLPMARMQTRVAVKEHDTHQVLCKLDPALVAHVKSVSKLHHCTPFHFYLAAFKTMLFKLSERSGTEEVTIGIADANRQDMDTMGSIGFFLNLLTLRFRRQIGQKFADALTEARGTAYAALTHSSVPFDVLLSELNVARSSKYSPFFQAFFDYRQGIKLKQKWADAELEYQEVHPGRTAYDLSLDVSDSDKDCVIIFKAQKDLYDMTATILLSETFVHLVRTLSQDTLLGLEETPSFGDRQLSGAIKTGCGKRLVSDWPATLPHRIDQMAEQHPDDLALVDGVTHSLTYAAMISRIKAIGEALKDSGVRPDSAVLVFQDASSDWICSMLAIMRIGAIYVPLDLRNPLPRLAVVARDCAPDAVITDNHNANSVSKLNIPNAAVVNVSGVPMGPSVAVRNSAKANSPAAILYTSGSTGTPKGIMVTHAGLRNEIEGYTKTWNLGAERVLQQSAYTFNHSSDQIYTGLVNGGTVYTVPSTKRGDPTEITKMLVNNSITYTKATPSEYGLWMQFAPEQLRSATSWRKAFGGGESLTGPTLQQFASLGLSQLRLFNSYGPTEISISSTKMEVQYRDASLWQESRVPCGYPLPNYHQYILSPSLEPLPIGMPGELYIGGAGVSLGYLNNDELTRKHFVQNPFATEEDIANGWTRMYRTGDLCHQQADGALVFHSRMAGDSQIRLRGLRIELSDIESNIVLAAKGNLKDAVVTLRKGDPSDFLIAHVTFAPTSKVADQKAFLEDLLRHLPLPQYMIPVMAIPLGQLPLNNHSKVDRAKLRRMSLPSVPSQTLPAGGDAQAKEDWSEGMQQLRLVWLDTLGNKELGLPIKPSSSFFQVGGNSLLVIRLQAKVQQTFHVAIPLFELLQAETLRDMAELIRSSASAASIDWETETAPPEKVATLGLIPTPPATPKDTKVVAVTGATGFLGKRILPRLIADPNVSTIHCLAVREKASDDEQRKQLFSSPKVVMHTGDLSLPKLGLKDATFNEIADEVDVILHLGAVRSFWDSYQVLRPTNVSSTQCLVSLAARRQASIHYMSSLAVLPTNVALSEEKAISAAAYPPPTDGSNGYVATRWASERILERAAQELGINVCIHRFTPSPSPEESSAYGLQELVKYVDESAILPDLSGWEGRMDLAPAREVVDWVSEQLLSKSEASPVRFLHLNSSMAVLSTELAAYVEGRKGEKGLGSMPLLKWIGKIKTLGFDFVLTSQEATLSTEKGGFVSRR